jgi:hypothetical protein
MPQFSSTTVNYDQNRGKTPKFNIAEVNVTPGHAAVENRCEEFEEEAAAACKSTRMTKRKNSFE